MTQDPRLPDAFLLHAAFVRRLAGALVRDAGQADDVTQDTWLAALGGAGRTVHSPRGWLARVVRNAASKVHRSETRRVARERRAARQEALPSAADEVARLETLRHLHAAIHRLPVAQQATLLLRYEERCSVREIAARLGVPLDTVKSRLRLALDRLRNDLEPRPGNERRVAWPALLLRPASSAKAAESGFAALASSTTTGATLVAGTAKQGIVVGAILLFVGGIYLAWAPNGNPPGAETLQTQLPTSTSPTPAGQTHAAPTLLGESSAIADAIADRHARDPATPPPIESAALPRATEILTPPDVLEALLLDGDEPVTRGTALLWEGGNFTTAGQIPVGHDSKASEPLSREGLLRFAGLADGPWYIGFELGDGVPRLYYAQQVTGVAANKRLQLVLGRSGVRGTVWGPDGAPLEGALVRAGSPANDGAQWIAQVRTRDDGSYSIDRLTAGMSWVTFCLNGDLDDSESNHHRVVHLEADRYTTVDFGTATGLARFVGVLRCADGTPVTGGGRVILGRPDIDGFLIVEYDEQGRYDQQMPEAVYQASIWPPGSSGLDARLIENPIGVRAPEAQIDLVLPGTRVVGRVADAADAGMRGWVAMHGPPPAGRPGKEQRRHVQLRDDGSFAAFGLEPGRYTIQAAVEHPVPRSMKIETIELVQGQVEARVELVPR